MVEVKSTNQTTYVDRLNINSQNYIYGSITEAMRYVESNGTVKVVAGEYPEEIHIYKPLHLVSIDGENTYLGDNNGGNAITLHSNDVIIEGFTITGGDSGIYIINGSNYILRNNTIIRCKRGINILEGLNCEINNNTILDCEIGAWVKGSNYQINNNSISKASCGVSIIAYNSKFINNYISDCEVGVSIKDSLGIEIESCDIANIYEAGIHLDNSSKCIINKNLLDIDVHTNVGIHLIKSNYNTIGKNIIEKSNDGVVINTESFGNIIEPNNVFSGIRSCDIYFFEKNDFKNTSCPGVCTDKFVSSSNTGLCKKCQIG